MFCSSQPTRLQRLQATPFRVRGPTPSSFFRTDFSRLEGGNAQDVVRLHHFSHRPISTCGTIPRFPPKSNQSGAALRQSIPLPVAARGLNRAERRGPKRRCGRWIIIKAAGPRGPEARPGRPGRPRARWRALRQERLKRHGPMRSARRIVFSHFAFAVEIRLRPFHRRGRRGAGGAGPLGFFFPGSPPTSRLWRRMCWPFAGPGPCNSRVSLLTRTIEPLVAQRLKEKSTTNCVRVANWTVIVWICSTKKLFGPAIIPLG